MLRSRRILVALALAALVLSASVVAVSEASKQSDEATVELVTPRVGDRAVYVGGPTGPDGGSWLFGPTSRHAFEWLPDQVHPAATGDDALVNRLQTWRPPVEGESSDSEHGWKGDRIVHYDPATGVFYAHWGKGTAQATHRSSSTIQGSTTYETQSESTGTLYHSFPPMCGLRNPWHMTGQPLEAATVEVCNQWGREAPATEPAKLEFRDGLLKITTESGAVELWLDAEASFPVRIVNHYPSATFRYELQAFERGDGPALQVTEDPLSYGTPPPHSPLQPWGLDETDVELPFGLEASYRAALEAPDSEAATFLDEHPDAVLAQANGRFDPEGGHNIWSFVWAEGDDGMKATVFEMPMRPLYPLTDIAVDDPRSPWVSFEPESPDRKFPDASDMPDSPPRLAGLESIWRSHLPDQRKDLPISGLSMWLFCGGASCNDPHLLVTLDYHLHTVTNQTTTASMLGESEHRHEFARMTFTPEGRAHSYSTNLDPVSGEPVFAGAEETEPKRFVDPGGLHRAAAFVGPEAAAGVGFVSLIAAGLYLVWPALKQAIVAPLFSRIGRDDLLEHPARELLMQVLTADPGLHAEEIVRRTGLPRGSVRHHLRKLRDARLIRATKQGRRLTFRIVPSLPG